MRRVWVRLAAALVLACGVLVGVLSPQIAAASTVGGEWVSKQVRILNTQTGTGGVSNPLQAGTWTSINVAGAYGLPSSGINAVKVTFTALSPSATGYLYALPDGSTATPTVSFLNYDASRQASNSADIALGSNGNIKVRVSSATDLVIDVEGYYTTGQTAAGGFVAVNNVVAGNTADGTGSFPSSLATGSTTVVPIAGHFGVPTNASAVELEITAGNTTTADGSIAVYPSQLATPPNTSLTFSGNRLTSWSEPIQLDASGAVAVRVRYGGPVSLSIAVIAYFGSLTATDSGAQFIASQSRVDFSQTDGEGPLAPGETRTIQVTGAGAVPDLSVENVDTVDVNVHAIPSAAASNGSYLYVWSTSDIGTSNRVYFGSSTTSSMSTIQLSAVGDISITNTSNVNVDVATDVEGWYDNPNADDYANATQEDEPAPALADLPANGTDTETTPVLVNGAYSAHSSRGTHAGVTIYLTGSGLKVDKWETLYDINGRNSCFFAVFWYGPEHHANNIYRTSKGDCGQGALAYAELAHSTTWANQTQLCNSWFYESVPGNKSDMHATGKACEMVHS